MKKYSVKYKYWGRTCYGAEYTRALSSCNGVEYFARYSIEIIAEDGDAIIYDNGDGRQRRAGLQLARWARGLHGNAPAGTLYGWHVVQLRNGDRVRFNVYI